MGREPAARLSVGAERDVPRHPGRHRAESVRKPADWEPGRAVTDAGEPDAAAGGSGHEAREQPGLELTRVLTASSSASQTFSGRD